MAAESGEGTGKGEYRFVTRRPGRRHHGSSKGEPEAELELSSRGRLCDAASGAGGYVSIGCVEDGMVEGVEEIHAEVQGLFLPEGKLLVQGDVDQGDSVAAQRDNGGVAKRPTGRLMADVCALAQAAVVNRSHEGTGVKPAVDAPFAFSQVAICDAIGEH